jgi:hypothetical protein
MSIIGYARVSTTDQDLSIQEAALRSAGCEVIRAEKRSGTTTAGRDELRTVFDFLRMADISAGTSPNRTAGAFRLARRGQSKVEVAPLAPKADCRCGRDGCDRNKRRLPPELNAAHWALKDSADFGFEPRKALVSKARAFDVAVSFGPPLNLLRSPYCGGPNEIGEGQEFLAV